MNFPTDLSVPLLVFGAAVVMVLLEQLVPAWRRPTSWNWWGRAALFNTAQAGVAALGALSWDLWFQGAGPTWEGSPWLGALCGYGLITFVYYWWHRARHQINPLWHYLHRLHHSPSRIEIVTSFYKHPLELVVNGLLSSALLQVVLGLAPEVTALTVLMTGLAELFYHWNIRTPRWLGWLIQRPEMHRVHHARGLHHYNYSDLPLWDALFGTLNNPRGIIEHCGFPEETNLKALLLGQPLREV